MHTLMGPLLNGDAISKSEIVDLGASLIKK